MKHFIKDIVGIKVYPSSKIDIDAKYGLNLYANKNRKYKIYSLPFIYKTNVSTENVYKYKWSIFPDAYDIYTETKICNSWHLYIKNNEFYSQINVILYLSDGDNEYFYFNTEEESNVFIKQYREKFNLIEFK